MPYRRYRFAPMLLAPLAAVLVSGCTRAAEPGPELGSLPDGECEATSTQQHLGKKANVNLGAALLSETGARTLRWFGPDMAVTMDFRPDRLTVSYDRDMLLNGIACG